MQTIVRAVRTAVSTWSVRKFLLSQGNFTYWYWRMMDVTPAAVNIWQQYRFNCYYSSSMTCCHLLSQATLWRFSGHRWAPRCLRVKPPSPTRPSSRCAWRGDMLEERGGVRRAPRSTIYAHTSTSRPWYRMIHLTTAVSFCGCLVLLIKAAVEGWGLGFAVRTFLTHGRTYQKNDVPGIRIGKYSYIRVYVYISPYQVLIVYIRVDTSRLEVMILNIEHYSQWL